MKIYDVVGWDNGYDFEKIVVGEGKKDRLLFPSVSYRPISGSSIFNVTDNNKGFSLDKMIIQYNNIEQFIGDYAIDQDPMGGGRTFLRDKFKEQTEIVKLLAGLTALSPFENKIVVNNLMLGLSLETYREYKDEVIQVYKDKVFEYKVPDNNHSNRTIELEIKNVVCIPQGVGAFYDKILNFEGRPSNGDLIDTRYGLIDAGGKTIDAFISKGDDPTRGSDIGLSYGTSDAFKWVSKKIGDVPYNLIEKAYINGKNEVYWNGKYIKIDDLCNQSFERLANDIYNMIQLEWARQLSRVELLILCGGGAIAIADYLKEVFNIKVAVVDDPQFANARGYYKLGVYANNKNKV